MDYFPLNNNGGKRNGYNIRIPLTEIILHLCIWSLIIEEIRQVNIHSIFRKRKGENLSVNIPSL